MKKTVKKTSVPELPYWLVGEWMEEKGESFARFKITLNDRVKSFELSVEGYDSSDNEIIEIKDITYINESLGFTSIVPSTHFAAYHQLTPGEHDGKVKHRLTFEESWIRKTNQVKVKRVKSRVSTKPPSATL